MLAPRRNRFAAKAEDQQRFEDQWDEQFEKDVAAGKFDQLGAQTLAEHRAGCSTPFPADLPLAHDAMNVRATLSVITGLLVLIGPASADGQQQPSISQIAASITQLGQGWTSNRVVVLFRSALFAQRNG